MPGSEPRSSNQSATLSMATGLQTTSKMLTYTTRLMRENVSQGQTMGMPTTGER